MQRDRIASPSVFRMTLVVGLMLTLPWAGGCTSEDPVVMERVVPPDVPGGAADAVIARPRTPRKSRTSRPEVKSIKSRMGGGEVK